MTDLRVKKVVNKQGRSRESALSRQEMKLRMLSFIQPVLETFTEHLTC